MLVGRLALDSQRVRRIGVSRPKACKDTYDMFVLREAKLTESIIGAFYEVYNTLGYGFLEHIYVMALERELRARGHHVAREVQVRVSYKGEELSNQRIEVGPKRYGTNNAPWGIAIPFTPFGHKSRR